MIRPLALPAVLAATLLAAAPAFAFETLAVVAVADPPAGPDADLAELAHQLRAACRDRVGGIDDVPTMRARLLGQRSNATVTELDRAYGGALAVYQNGEFESAIRTLKAIVEDLESLPETDESYAQWIRAQLRLAHAALTIGREKDADEAMSAVARTEPTVQPDPDQYSPSYRRKLEQTKAKIRALPSRKLQVNAEGFQGTVFVNGRPMGSTPLAVRLPAGTYRIGGASGSLHVPSFRVDLQAEDRTVLLDFALAEALRLHGGPGLALAPPRRSEGIVRAGAWLGADRVIAVSRATEGDAHFLLGSIFDVRNGALLREGSVRMIAGTVPAANLGALAAFLLTGQSSRDVKDRTDVARAAPAFISSAQTAERQQAARAAAAIPSPQPAAAIPSSAPPAAAGGSAAPKSSTPPTAAARSSAPKKAAAAAAEPASAAAAAGAAAKQAKSPVEKPAAGAAAKQATADGALAARAPADLAVAPSEISARVVADVEHPLQPPSARRVWMRRGAYGSAVLVGVFTGLAIQQGFSARQASADAERMVGQDGVLAPGSDATRYRQLERESRSAVRNAYLSGGAAIVFAATAGVLGWKARAPAGEPVLALRF